MTLFVEAAGREGGARQSAVPECSCRSRRAEQPPAAHQENFHGFIGFSDSWPAAIAFLKTYS